MCIAFPFSFTYTLENKITEKQCKIAETILHPTPTPFQKVHVLPVQYHVLKLSNIFVFRGKGLKSVKELKKIFPPY